MHSNEALFFFFWWLMGNKSNRVLEWFFLYKLRKYFPKCCTLFHQKKTLHYNNSPNGVSFLSSSFSPPQTGCWPFFLFVCVFQMTYFAQISTFPTSFVLVESEFGICFPIWNNQMTQKIENIFLFMIHFYDWKFLFI